MGLGQPQLVQPDRRIADIGVQVEIAAVQPDGVLLDIKALLRLPERTTAPLTLFDPHPSIAVQLTLPEKLPVTAVHLQRYT
jgi:hypothetical protein